MAVCRTSTYVAFIVQFFSAGLAKEAGELVENRVGVFSPEVWRAMPVPSFSNKAIAARGMTPVGLAVSTSYSRLSNCLPMT